MIKSDECDFCTTPSQSAGRSSKLRLARDPLRPGHLVLFPDRHVEHFLDLSDGEIADLASVFCEEAEVMSSEQFPWVAWAHISHGYDGPTTYCAHVHISLLPVTAPTLADPVQWRAWLVREGLSVEEWGGVRLASQAIHSYLIVSPAGAVVAQSKNKPVHQLIRRMLVSISESNAKDSAERPGCGGEVRHYE